MATGSGGRLILLCGLAGAGKTTVAKQLEAEGAVRMCPDEWLLALGFDIYDKDARVRVEALQWELAQGLLLRGLTVADECGVWQRWERDLRREWAREHGVAVELRFLDAPVDVLTARVVERNRMAPEGAPRIDPRLIAFWDARIERPDADEMALFDPPGVVIRVEPATRESVEALAEGDAVFSERFGVVVEADWTGVPEALPFLVDYVRSGGPAEWGPHLFFDDDGGLVGNGGWKGAPVDGSAELGYAVASSRRGRGIATAAVHEFVRRARLAGLAEVVAHTLAQESASTTVLTRCGFTRVGEVVDPVDGPVWRWELQL